MAISPIFQKAVQNGAQILDDGSAYICRKSRIYPNRYIQRVIRPNGNYVIQVSENGELIKRIYKYYLNGTSTLTDSWDFVKKQGVHLSNVILNEGKSLMSRVFDKVGELKIKQDGFIYLRHKGKADKFITEVTTLNGSTSVAKPFNPMGWLNNEFYKVFNK